MAKEEMAKEYVDALLNKDDAELDKFLNENLGDLQLTKKQAGTLIGIIKGVGINSFLAGFKAGESQWHDLRKNPNDLPPVERGSATIDVLTDNGEIAYYYYDESCWCDSNGNEIKSPKAWCEIPKYIGHISETGFKSEITEKGIEELLKEDEKIPLSISELRGVAGFAGGL
jgi:hypothetical protein